MRTCIRSVNHHTFAMNISIKNGENHFRGRCSVQKDGHFSNPASFGRCPASTIFLILKNFVPTFVDGYCLFELPEFENGAPGRPMKNTLMSKLCIVSFSKTGFGGLGEKLGSRTRTVRKA